MTDSTNSLSKATKNQCARIHILRQELRLSEDDYRAALASFGVESSKELSFHDAELLIQRFEQALPTNHPQRYSTKYEHLGIRFHRVLRRHYATPKQLRMLEAMWMSSPQVTTKTVEALEHFAKRITGKEKLEWLLIDDVQKVKKAIESLR